MTSRFNLHSFIVILKSTLKCFAFAVTHPSQKCCNNNTISRNIVSYLQKNLMLNKYNFFVLCITKISEINVK